MKVGTIFLLLGVSLFAFGTIAAGDPGRLTERSIWPQRFPITQIEFFGRIAFFLSLPIIFFAFALKQKK